MRIQILKCIKALESFKYIYVLNTIINYIVSNIYNYMVINYLG